MRISLEEIESIIRESLEPAKAQEILKKIEIVSEELRAEKPAKKQKNQYSVILIDTENKIPPDLELSGLVIKLPLEDDVNLILAKISEAARTQNNTTKGKKKLPINTIVEACERTKRKFMKEQNIFVITKDLVQIIKSSNSLVLIN